MIEGRTPTVLVVEDEASVRTVIRLVLQEHGYDVVTAEHGQAALERMNSHVPDVIVLDLQMPVMDGRTFYRELRSRGYTSPVLILSAYDARGARRELGADASIDKPFDVDNLLQTVGQLVEAVHGK